MAVETAVEWAPSTLELEDLMVSRFVEDSSVLGSPTAWTGSATCRPMGRLISDGKLSV